ncbi:hypothetical protein U9M48_013958 [Paspalum notatum var. saurae]|uniref:Reverse transcriptase Ty1/copia-type domain-containing protein n=1 Tax=Paspalum notatum var. saurae TaxID=547442 RepID=A0AAQ3T0A0_PASNO
MGPDFEKWLEAMRSKLKSMDDNQVWNLVKPLDECKWVFKKKIDADGNVHIYKARLVAKGFRVDYDETFSPVAMLKSIRIFLAIAAYHDYEQASQSWNLRFDEVVKGFGFIKNVEEPCVYKKVSGSALVFLVLYVDDILLIGNDIRMLEAVKDSLRKSFSMKDLGEAAYVLSIKIYRDRSKRLIGLSQSTYIDKCPSTIDEQKRMSEISYASAITSIMYAMICTRPDVSFALQTLIMSRIKDAFVVFGGEEELIVKGYTDVGFQTDKDESRSQAEFVFCLNGGAVSWKSSKQDTVADSATEAEYIAASEAANEAIWIRKFVSDLGVVPSASSPLDLYCDNIGAIAQAISPDQRYY